MGFESDLHKGNNLRHTIGYFFSKFNKYTLKVDFVKRLHWTTCFQTSGKHARAMNIPLNVTFI